ncbi:AI-2E family transporter [Candidatus Clostridium radicumherbarum]|uniref:AI-2E family transporter n=1 Tax=Candidatus Clostridium radicumherbarum TaxID=3381662 RepID=A0ABW8TUW6_9CLOT
MGFLKELFQKEITKRILVLITFIIFLYFLRGLINTFLLTFLFIYFIYSTENAITKRIGKFVHLSNTLFTLIIFLLMATLITFFIYKYIPVVINQIIIIINQMTLEMSEFDFKSSIHIPRYLLPIYEQVYAQIDFKNITKGGVDFLLQSAKNIGTWSVNIFLSLMLSMFFMLEKNKVSEFMRRFKDSRVSGFYRYLHDFGVNFLNSFGKVIQAQIIIAFINSCLSMIGLSILGFRQILGLGVMVFFFSLVPVAGTIASLVPLTIIAYRYGGLLKIFYVLILIAALHALESYVLNPKLMASKTDLPVFIIFIVLIISEHFMGVWGLLIGIPLFMFFLDLLNVKENK